MGINNKLSALRPELQRVYLATLPIYAEKYPTGLKIGLNETARSKAVQDAYYARGRQPVAAVQALYKAAGLYAIGAAEAQQKNTNAKFGQSAHTITPLSAAFDIKTTNAAGQYIDSPATCKAFWLLFQAEAKSQNVAVTWGGTFPSPDMPHIQLTNWTKLIH